MCIYLFTFIYLVILSIVTLTRCIYVCEDLLPNRYLNISQIQLSGSSRYKVKRKQCFMRGSATVNMKSSRYTKALGKLPLIYDYYNLCFKSSRLICHSEFWCLPAILTLYRLCSAVDLNVERKCSCFYLVFT